MNDLKITIDITTNRSGQKIISTCIAYDVSKVPMERLFDQTGHYVYGEVDVSEILTHIEELLQEKLSAYGDRFGS